MAYPALRFDHTASRKRGMPSRFTKYVSGLPLNHLPLTASKGSCSPHPTMASASHNLTATFHSCTSPYMEYLRNSAYNCSRRALESPLPSRYSRSASIDSISNILFIAVCHINLLHHAILRKPLIKAKSLNKPRQRLATCINIQNLYFL